MFVGMLVLFCGNVIFVIGDSVFVCSAIDNSSAFCNSRSSASAAALSSSS